MSNHGLVFLHIPKTAGMTLRRVIDRQYPRGAAFHVNAPRDLDRLRALPEAERRRLRVVQGHVTYGVHEHLFVPVKYITMLRHPVELVASMYYYLQRTLALQRTTVPDIAALVEGKTLVQFADGPSHFVRNLQTASVSGIAGVPDGAALELARHNLAQTFAAFGLVERFDESLLLFARRLAWRNLFYRRVNVTRDRPAVHSLDAATVALVRRNNALDVELYEFAAGLFETRLADQPRKYWRALRRFRQFNPVGSFLNDAYRKARGALPGRVRRRVPRRARAVAP